MKRDKWIDEILKPWKPGDVLQYRYGDDKDWQDCGDYREDPVSRDPDLSGCEYRIKPKPQTVRLVIECLDQSSADTFLHIVKIFRPEAWGTMIIEEIRAAKQLPE